MIQLLQKNIVAIFFITGLLFSQPAFVFQNPQPSGNHILDIHFFNNTKGIAIGAGNTILTTNDGGVSWQQMMPSGSSSNRENNGWIVGASIYGFSESVVLATSDGGATWSMKNSGTLPSKPQGVFFRSASTGWVVGDDGKVSRTTNGGTSWSAQTSGITNHLYEVFFRDDSSGFIFGDLGQIRRTTNGGTTWSPVINPMSKILGHHFLDKDTGYIVGTGAKIAKTTDGGSTWNTLAIGSSDDIQSVYFSSPENGWVTRSNGKVFRTTNYGVTWTDLGYVNGGFSSTYSLNAVRFFDASNGVTLGNAGIVYRTTNGGTNWTIVGGGVRTDLDAVFFRDKNNGYAVGSTNSASYIAKTNNGGSVWNFKTISGKPRSITFVNQNYGWYAGDNGLVYKTTDGGVSWKSQTANFSLKIRSMSFIDTLTGWIAGDNANAAKTTDGGTNWTNQIFQATSVVMTGPSTVLRATSGIVYRSTNNGASWDSTNGRGTKITFIDSLYGWTLNGSKIMQTTDGGQVWIEKSLPSTSVQQNAIRFATRSRGWIVGTSGLLLQTTDGGTTWEQRYIGTANDLRDVASPDSLQVWIVGTNGTILGPKIGVSTRIGQLSGTASNYPEKIILGQNYPNPFNPSTRIEYTIPLNGMVRLKVYDAIGREVATIVQQQMNAGSYSAEFNGAGLSSGVYFYQVTSGSFTAMKKMILIK